MELIDSEVYGNGESALPRPRTLAAAVLALAVLTIAPGATTTARSVPVAAPGALPPAAQALVSRALGRDQARYRIGRSGSAFTARTVSQGFSARFDAHGIHVRAGDGTLGLRLRSAAPVAPSAHANRVSYRRGALTEWYTNGPLGLEQGFTLKAPPARARSGPLTLALALSGSMQPRLDRGGKSLTFAGSSLRYTGLTAFDAHGHALPARLELDDHTLLIRVADRGAHYPLTIDPFFQEAKLTASDFVNGDEFGFSVATSGDTIAVGSPMAPGNEAGQYHAGAVYVFSKPAGGWANATETAKLRASDGEALTELGGSVAISGDTIVSGAPYTLGGAAYVFVKPAGGWTSGTETAKLTASDAVSGDYLGASVAIAGGTIVAGAPDTHIVSGVAGPGAAYVFVKPPGGWASGTETAKLTASDGVEWDGLGGSVSISGDTIVAGAQGADVSGHADQGAAYVFVKPVGSWTSATQTAKLTTSDGAAGDALGDSVAISGDTIVAGASAADIAGHADQGAAYVFVKPVASWTSATQTAKLTTSDGAASDHVGWAVAISGDTILAGKFSYWWYPSRPGATYVFVKPAGGWASGTETAKLTTLGAGSNQVLGWSVAASGDTFVSGDNLAVYVFGQAPATITVTKQLLPASDPGRFDLKAAGKVVKAGAGNGDAGANGVAPGTYRVAEAAAPGTTLSAYSTSIACTMNGDPGPSANGPTQLDVTVADGDQAACTITNRRKPQVTLTKHLVPASDPGRFDLKVGGTLLKAGAGDGDSGSTTLPAAGTYTLSEVAAPGTSLLDYFSSFACTLNGRTGPSGTGSTLNVNLTWGDALACTITNRPGGTITLTKQLFPSSDAGRFDLRVGQTLVKAAAGNGSSGSAQFLPGSYRVTESAAGGASLSNYSTSIACTVNGNPGPSADGTTQVTVTVAAGDRIACTLANRRKATITLTKHLVPTADPGRFDLRIGANVVKAGAGNGDSGSITGGAATYKLSEVAAAGTNLADYSSSIACTRNGNPGPGGNGTTLSVNVSWGDVLACTITNQRR